VEREVFFLKKLLPHETGILLSKKEKIFLMPRVERSSSSKKDKKLF
jgi:hypothetical protein